LLFPALPASPRDPGLSNPTTQPVPCERLEEMGVVAGGWGRYVSRLFNTTDPTELRMY
jgi:hypothetical protein